VHGYGAAWLAIWMLFHPYKPVKLFGITIWPQGMIPRHRARLAQSIGNAVGNELVSQDTVFDALAEIRDRGTTLVVIEQHVDRALAFADYVVLLTQGRVVYRGLAAEIGDQVERLLPGEPA